MTIGTKALKIALLVAAGTFGPIPLALAEEDGFLGGDFGATISMLNDYRFRGLSRNDEGFALQGGLDWYHDSGFYVGTWASNISNLKGATVETDFYAGYAGELEGGLNFDLGGLLYHFPGGTDADYVEVYGSFGMDLGFVSALAGANYAFSNDNLDFNNRGGEDNIYLFTDGSVAIPNTPLTLNLHLGYEDGSLNSRKWDWSVGASVPYQGLDFSVTYVDTNFVGDNADATVVFSVGASF